MTTKTGLVKEVKKSINSFTLEFTARDVYKDLHLQVPLNKVSSSLNWLIKKNYIKIVRKENRANIYVVNKSGIRKTVEPELDYSQIGKAIIERIKILDQLANTSLYNQHQVEGLQKKLAQSESRCRELETTVESLNKQIGLLNQKIGNRNKEFSNSTFKLGDIARIS